MQESEQSKIYPETYGSTSGIQALLTGKDGASARGGWFLRKMRNVELRLHCSKGCHICLDSADVSLELHAPVDVLNCSAKKNRFTICREVTVRPFC